MDKVDHFCSQHVTHVKYGGHRDTRREHTPPPQAPCSYLEGDVVLHLMDKVDHFCSQHVTHVKYGGNLCYRFKALILETFRFSEDENDDDYEIF